MSDYDIHSCGYYCDRFACIVAQRNELRDKLFSNQAVKTYSGGKPNYTQPIEKEWVGLTDEEIAEIYRAGWSNGADFARTLEAMLKEKNSTSEKIIQTSDKND
jgi:hypothetical protein